MKKLFAVLLGGDAPGATIELHDIVFVASETIEDSYPELKSKWFGSKKGVHLDSWVELNYCEGHKIQIVPKLEKIEGPQLYFVNIGSYPPGRLEEAHTYLFLVGNSATEVKERAKKLAPAGHLVPHKDNLILIDDVIPLGQVGDYSVQLIPAPGVLPANPIHSDYRPI